MNLGFPVDGTSMPIVPTPVPIVPTPVPMVPTSVSTGSVYTSVAGRKPFAGARQRVGIALTVVKTFVCLRIGLKGLSALVSTPGMTMGMAGSTKLKPRSTVIETFHSM